LKEGGGREISSPRAGVRSWDSQGVRLEVPVGVSSGKGVCTSSSGDGLGTTPTCAQEERRRGRIISSERNNFIFTTLRILSMNPGRISSLYY
jgi:hypothetical protein